MNQRSSGSRVGLWRAPFLSPKDLVLRAMVLGALFAIAHFAGLREYTSFLCGTSPSPEASWERTAFGGTIYLLLYFGLVLFVPVLLLAALLQVWLGVMHDSKNHRRLPGVNRADAASRSFRWHKETAPSNLPVQDED